MLIFVLTSCKLRSPLVIGLTLIISGGVGSLIGRALHTGAVIDFMNLGIVSLRTGIFNVAGVAIMPGSGMLILIGAQRSATSLTVFSDRFCRDFRNRISFFISKYHYTNRCDD